MGTKAACKGGRVREWGGLGYHFQTSQGMRKPSRCSFEQVPVTPSQLLHQPPASQLKSSLPYFKYLFFKKKTTNRAKVQRGGKLTQCAGCGGGEVVERNWGEKHGASPDLLTHPGVARAKRATGTWRQRLGPASPIQPLAGPPGPLGEARH